MNVEQTFVYNNLRDEGWEVICQGWPDMLAFRASESGEGIEALFIEHKSRNYALKPHQLKVLQVLEALGLQVRVSLGGGTAELVTLTDYLNLGTSASGSLSVMSPQTIYNYRSEIKKMQRFLDQARPDDPRRVIIEDTMKRRIAALPAEFRSMFTEKEMAQQKKEETSAEKLKRIQDLVAEELPPDKYDVPKGEHNATRNLSTPQTQPSQDSETKRVPDNATAVETGEVNVEGQTSNGGEG